MSNKGNRGRRVVGNFVSLAFGKSAGNFLTFLLLVVLANAFGEEGIGIYSLAMASTGLLMMFADFGLYSFSIRTISRQAGGARLDYGAIFAARLVMSTVAATILVVAVSGLPLERTAQAVILLLGLYHVSYPLLNGLASVLVSHEHMRRAALLEFLLRLSIAALGGAAVIAGGSLAVAVAAFPVATVLHIFVVYAYVSARYGAPPILARWSAIRATLRRALPFALSNCFAYIGGRVDVILLGLLLGAVAAGTYNVAYRVIFVVMFIPHFAGVALFPLASRLHLHALEELRDLYQRSLNAAVLVGIPAAVGLWLIAPTLIRVLFGTEFAQSALVLQVLSAAICVIAVREIMGVFLMATDREAVRTRAQFTMAGASIVFNLTLIPVFGTIGAAVAVVLSQLVGTVCFAAGLRTLLGWPAIWSRVVIAGVASLAFCAPFVLAPPLPLVLTIPGAVAIYAVMLILFPTVRAGEIRILVGWVRSGRPASAE